ncbi:MAG: DUF2262 domain-containing protein [Planctomycetes bacterium]|nr:DUF2262 domain-containing protein [Planctomycetota bacterium]
MPAKIEHPVLGTLTFVTYLDAWETKVELQSGSPVDLRLTTRFDLGPTYNIESLLQRGVEMLHWARCNDNACRERIADKLHELYNDTWAPEATSPISRHEFIKRITPHSLRLDIDGSGFFGWADDGMFAGHWIELRFRKDWTISEVGLSG